MISPLLGPPNPGQGTTEKGDQAKSEVIKPTGTKGEQKWINIVRRVMCKMKKYRSRNMENDSKIGI